MTTDEERAFIRSEVVRIRARRILEIGSLTGETTAALCRASAPFAGHVVVIDPMNWCFDVFANGLGVPFPTELRRWLPALWPFDYERAFWRRLRADGHEDDVTVFRASSTDERLIARRHPLLEGFDLVYLDGDTTVETTYSDVRHWAARVRVGGVVLMHVAAGFDGAVKVFRTCAREARYRATLPKEAGSLGKLEVLSRPGVVRLTSASLGARDVRERVMQRARDSSGTM